MSPNLRAGEVEAKNFDLQKCTNCWICEGWIPITFRFKHHESNLPSIKIKEKDNVFLHLRVDNFEPDIMYRDKSNPGEYYKVRMVPAMNIQFYFTINGIPMFRQDLNLINTNPKQDSLLRDLEAKGQNIPWKVNLLLCGPQNRIEIDMKMLEELNCLPRPKRFAK